MSDMTGVGVASVRLDTKDGGVRLVIVQEGDDMAALVFTDPREVRRLIAGLSSALDAAFPIGAGLQ